MWPVQCRLLSLNQPEETQAFQTRGGKKLSFLDFKFWNIFVFRKNGNATSALQHSQTKETCGGINLQSTRAPHMTVMRVTSNLETMVHWSDTFNLNMRESGENWVFSLDLAKMYSSGSLETTIFFLFRHPGSLFQVTLPCFSKRKLLLFRRESAPAALKTRVHADAEAAHSIFGF